MNPPKRLVENTCDEKSSDDGVGHLCLGSCWVPQGSKRGFLTSPGFPTQVPNLYKASEKCLQPHMSKRDQLTTTLLPSCGAASRAKSPVGVVFSLWVRKEEVLTGRSEALRVFPGCVCIFPLPPMLSSIRSLSASLSGTQRLGSQHVLSCFANISSACPWTGLTSMQWSSRSIHP